MTTPRNKAAEHEKAAAAKAAYYAGRPNRRCISAGQPFRRHFYDAAGRCFHATKGRRPMFDMKPATPDYGVSAK